ncbi:uncharacterized protein LOC110825272 [Carica papaya]|uniref:uncharacterized protein LOC110825272 n=1 Tax=Carica papaya TaxID=3649 RepID=UPI000B8CF283|nr:uncharacterized protein LOC110825272 [Carica papaya]
MDSTIKLGSKIDDKTVDKGRYQRLVGKLIYLAHTKPDISFAVSVTRMLCNKLADTPMDSTIKLGSKISDKTVDKEGQELFFQKIMKREIEIFTDADWAGSINDRKSTSSYCTYVWGNLVTWSSKKQSVIMHL